MKNEHRLEKIYEEIANKTYENVGYEILLDDNINQEKIEHYTGNFFKEIYMESFPEGTIDIDYIDKKSVRNGINATIDRFRFTINNDIIYFVDVSYMLIGDYLQSLDGEIMMQYTNKDNYNKILSFKNDLIQYKNRKIVYFDFKTSETEYNLTGKVKRFSYNIFGSVVRAMRQSFRYNERVKEVSSIYYIINKNEPKRINIYNAIIEHELPSHLNKRFTDYFTDPKYYKIYMYE